MYYYLQCKVQDAFRKHPCAAHLTIFLLMRHAWSGNLPIDLPRIHLTVISSLLIICHNLPVSTRSLGSCMTCVLLRGSFKDLLSLKHVIDGSSCKLKISFNIFDVTQPTSAASAETEASEARGDLVILSNFFEHQSTSATSLFPVTKTNQPPCEPPLGRLA